MVSYIHINNEKAELAHESSRVECSSFQDSKTLEAPQSGLKKSPNKTNSCRQRVRPHTQSLEQLSEYYLSMEYPELATDQALESGPAR